MSLGLKRAGWRGLFAIEKDRFAFETLKANFLTDGARFPYDWPEWLACKPWSVEEFLEQHSSDLARLRGRVQLLVGGPPCQGFSTAGLRKVSDPRNALIDRYLDCVEVLQPQIVLLENVIGFTRDFSVGRSRHTNFSRRLQNRLERDYQLFTNVLDASRFGVPQNRKRFILVGIRRSAKNRAQESPFQHLEAIRNEVLRCRGLPRYPTARTALSDLTINRNGKVPSIDTEGFEAIGYRGPISAFQRTMREGCTVPPSDTRLARHSPEVTERFERIIRFCRETNRSFQRIPDEVRELTGTRKGTIRVLDPLQPAPTITSMPDDLLHYSEPRILTVRENARLQTFPDWFVFRGKYTSGGDMRGKEVPRFTQVANAVPPLLAEILGLALLRHAVTRPKAH